MPVVYVTIVRVCVFVYFMTMLYKGRVVFRLATSSGFPVEL